MGIFVKEYPVPFNVITFLKLISAVSLEYPLVIKGARVDLFAVVTKLPASIVNIISFLVLSGLVNVNVSAPKLLSNTVPSLFSTLTVNVLAVSPAGKTKSIVSVFLTNFKSVIILVLS